MDWNPHLSSSIGGEKEIHTERDAIQDIFRVKKLVINKEMNVTKNDLFEEITSNRFKEIGSVINQYLKVKQTTQTISNRED